MRLATFSIDTRVGDQTRIGVVGDDGGYLDVTAGYAALLDSDGEPSPSEMAEAVPEAEFPSARIGEMVMEGLRQLEGCRTAGRGRDS